jgi:hypothetical protein
VIELTIGKLGGVSVNRVAAVGGAASMGEAPTGQQQNYKKNTA